MTSPDDAPTTPSLDVLTDDVEGLLRRADSVLPGVPTAWRTRSVHSHGGSSRSVVFEVDVEPRAEDGDGSAQRGRTVLVVAHSSASRVPSGDRAARFTHLGARVHVWPFPHDPYMPGLATAVNRRDAGALLASLGLGDGGLATLRTRAYRPTRRAVVAVRPDARSAPALYRKVLGGRTAARVVERAEALATTHDHLARHLPVPPVLSRDLSAGLVDLGALPGETLRSLLRAGRTLPPAEEVAELVRRLVAVPRFAHEADPARYADVTRHVTTLRQLLPERSQDLAAIAAAVADIGGPVGMLHGDLHDGQLLVEDGHLTGMLDVDGVGSGPIALDIGRLVANVEVAQDHGPDGARVAPGYARALEHALTDLAPAPDVAAAAAAAWIGLATGPHRVQSSRWRERTHQRIDRALSWTVRRGQA